jgi:hypothetical protein
MIPVWVHYLDMFESTRKQLVWRGIVSKTIEPGGTPEKTAEEHFGSGDQADAELPAEEEVGVAIGQESNDGKTESARTLMLEESFGVLSTISVDVPGYPFGSVTPYCLDRMNRPVVYISPDRPATRRTLWLTRESL